MHFTQSTKKKKKNSAHLTVQSLSLALLQVNFIADLAWKLVLGNQCGLGLHETDYVHLSDPPSKKLKTFANNEAKPRGLQYIVL